MSFLFTPRGGYVTRDNPESQLSAVNTMIMMLNCISMTD